MKRPFLLVCLAICRPSLRRAQRRRAASPTVAPSPATAADRCPAAHRRSDAYAASPNPSAGHTN